MATNQPVLERTEGVYRELRAMRRHFRVGSWITLIVGGLLLLLVMAYFTIGYREISSFRDPDLIVSLVGSMAEQQIPTMRRTAEEQVKNNASQWAEQASQQVLELIPQGREQLEALALQQSDEMIARIDKIGEKYFHEVLDQNRELVQNAIDQLKSDDEISEGAVIAIREALEKQFEIDGDNQAAALVAIASDINKNLDKLAVGENLSREKKAERRVLMLARQIHSDRFGDMTLDHITDTLNFKPVTEHLEEQEKKRLQEERAEQAEASKEALVEVAKVDSQQAPEVTEKQPAAQPEEKKEEAKAAEEKKPAQPKAEEKKAEEPAKAAEKPEAKKEAPAEEKKPAEPKAEEKKAEEPAKAAEKPEAKKEAPAEEKKPAEPKAEEPAKAAEKPEAKKEAPAEEKKPAEEKEEPKPEEKKAEG